MTDPILELAKKIYFYIKDGSEDTQQKIHETVAALDIVKHQLYQEWFDRNKQLFENELNKLKDGDINETH